MPDRRVTAAQRRAVIRRAKGCCEYCQSQARFATQSFAAEPIIPRVAGGPTALDNLALSCLSCNSHKHAKTHAIDPETGQEVPLFHPRRQDWIQHFRWSEDFTIIIGLTSTVEQLSPLFISIVLSWLTCVEFFTLWMSIRRSRGEKYCARYNQRHS